MPSDHHKNLPRNYVPTPPLTECGGSLDSGRAPQTYSIDSSYSSPYGSSFKIADRSARGPDLAGSGPRYHMPGFGPTMDGIPEIQQLADAVSNNLTSLDYAQLSKLRDRLEAAQQEVDLQLQELFTASNGLQLPNSMPSRYPDPLPLGPFYCHMCKEDDRIYPELSSFQQHLEEHGVQNWEYHCPEPDCSLTVPQLLEMMIHMRSLHHQFLTDYQMAQNRTEVPCPSFCVPCSYPTANWTIFYQHAQDPHLKWPERTKLPDEGKRGCSTYPRGQLEQKRTREQENRYTVDPNIPTSNRCSRCNHNTTECRICCSLTGLDQWCHICHHSVAHEMGACVTASKTLSTPIIK
jgi:hypothetical protein